MAKTNLMPMDRMAKDAKQPNQVGYFKKFVINYFVM